MDCPAACRAGYTPDRPVARRPPPPATAAEMDGLLAHMEETARAIGFLDPAAPRYLMRRLWRLFQRARLDRTEVNILRGFLKAVLLAARRGEGE